MYSPLAPSFARSLCRNVPSRVRRAKSHRTTVPSSQPTAIKLPPSGSIATEKTLLSWLRGGSSFPLMTPQSFTLVSPGGLKCMSRSAHLIRGGRHFIDQFPKENRASFRVMQLARTPKGCLMFHVLNEFLKIIIEVFLPDFCRLMEGQRTQRLW
jgi:hypothetical protein